MAPACRDGGCRASRGPVAAQPARVLAGSHGPVRRRDRDQLARSQHLPRQRLCPPFSFAPTADVPARRSQFSKPNSSAMNASSATGKVTAPTHAVPHSLQFLPGQHTSVTALLPPGLVASADRRAALHPFANAQVPSGAAPAPPVRPTPRVNPHLGSQGCVSSSAADPHCPCRQPAPPSPRVHPAPLTCAYCVFARAGQRPAHFVGPAALSTVVARAP